MSLMLVIGIAVLAFAGVLVLFWVIARVTGGTDSAIEERMDQFVSREERKLQVDKGERTSSAFTKSLDEAVAGRSFAQNLSTQLARANL